MKDKKKIEKFLKSVRKKHKELLEAYNRQQVDILNSVRDYTLDGDFGPDEIMDLLGKVIYKRELDKQLELTTKIIQVLGE